MEQAWAKFRSLPWWGQGLLWVLIWPALAGLVVWIRWGEEQAWAKAGAVVLALVITPAWWAGAANGGGDDEPAQTEQQVVAEDEEADSPSPDVEAEGEEPDRDEPQQQAGWDEDDVEYQLATIDSGYVPTDDPTIDIYARALDRAETKCNEDRRIIGDMAVRSTQVLEGEGVSATALEMIEGVGEAVPPEAAPMDCSEVLASMMALMTSN